ncbi:hypothetical protein [Solitalea koreensis]|uniref:hypothetical protein n=1 Tax=Solitalea koreensis TaxID=543615 RepID=UPI001159FDB3|nr:hypothetical protein [Solitalea koreensis]
MTYNFIRIEHSATSHVLISALYIFGRDADFSGNAAGEMYTVAAFFAYFFRFRKKSKARGSDWN